jgi:2-polyprenyl-6-hydroxyphenyl methylase/3-demethylubiquinone-9 3-methyltransferase
MQKKINLISNYFVHLLKNLKIKKKFDVILNMEIIEHVEDINFFLNLAQNF